MYEQVLTPTEAKVRVTANKINELFTPENKRMNYYEDQDPLAEAIRNIEQRHLLETQMLEEENQSV
jgi:hypothetical protein